MAMFGEKKKKKKKVKVEVRRSYRATFFNLMSYLRFSSQFLPLSYFPTHDTYIMMIHIVTRT